MGFNDNSEAVLPNVWVMLLFENYMNMEVESRPMWTIKKFLKAKNVDIE